MGAKRYDLLLKSAPKSAERILTDEEKTPKYRTDSSTGDSATKKCEFWTAEAGWISDCGWQGWYFCFTSCFPKCF